MIRFVLHVIIPLTLSVSLAGCVSIPHDAGFASVQQTVDARTGQHVHWNQGTAADQEINNQVWALLRKDRLGETDVIAVALLNNCNLQATYEELGIAQADLVEAGLLRNPTLGLEVRFPDLPAIPYDINLTQNFIDLLLMPIRKRAAEAHFEAVKLRVTHEILGTVGQVSAAYYRAQGAAELVQMRRQISEATAAALAAAKSLHDAGNINDLDYANQQALHEQAVVDLASAEAAALDAREALSALLGIWGTEINWRIAERLPDLQAPQVTTSGLESLAVSQRTDLAAAGHEVEAAAGEIGLTQYSAFSDLAVGVHVEKDADRSLTIGPRFEIPLPIFNQGQPARAAAVARFRQSRFRYIALATDIRGQVRRAQNTLAAARQRAEYFSRVIVPLRHEIVRQTQLHYNAMTVGVFQLLQAKQAEIEAGREYVQALQDYWLARAELQRVVEGRLETPATRPTTVPSAEK